MSVTLEILRTYCAPREVTRRLLASTARSERPEAHSLVHLLAGCFIVFVSAIPFALQGGEAWPPDAPVEMRVANTFFAWMFIAPLIFYLLAALAHLLARILGGRGSFQSARAALFWCVLAVSPLMLLNGMVTRLIGDGPQQKALGLAIAVVFLGLWVISLVEAERPRAT